MEKAEAVLKQKGGVSERRHQLVERGVVAQEAAEDTLSATEVAKAELGQARSGVGVARADLEQAKAVLGLRRHGSPNIVCSPRMMRSS